MSDTTIAINSRIGELQDSQLVSNAFAEGQKQRTRMIKFAKTTTDGAAGTATAEQLMDALQFVGQVLEVDVTLDAAVAANGANFATIIIQKRDATGLNPFVVASLSTATISFGQWVTYRAISAATGLTVANLAVVALGMLTIQITKSGTGVVIPTGVITVRVLDQ